jgi:hypothetical protein
MKKFIQNLRVAYHKFWKLQADTIKNETWARLYWLGGIFIGLAYILWKNGHYFEARLGITLAVVEIPIIVFGAVVANIILRESLHRQKEIEEGTTKALERVQSKERKINELKDNITRHEQLIIPVFNSWVSVGYFQEGILKHQIDQQWVVLTYDLKINSVELHIIRNYNQNIVNDAAAHLRTGKPEKWDEWITLKEQVNSQLKRVGNLWAELVKTVETECKNQGFEQTAQNLPVEYYHLPNLIQNIWWITEFNKTDEQIEAAWKITQIGDYWQIGSFLRSAKREKLENLKKFCLEEAKKIVIKTSGLFDERDKLQKKLSEFLQSMKVIFEDSTIKNLPIFGDCDTCRHWKSELEELSK